LFWWQALGGIFAKEHSNVFLYEPGGVVGSQDHACFEAQRRIGKRLAGVLIGQIGLGILNVLLLAPV
jgi:hypothetical protein